MLKIIKITALLGCSVVLLACGESSDNKRLGFADEKGRNFLIGKCIVNAGENSAILIDYACNASKASQYLGMPNFVPYNVYKEKTIQVNLIIGLSTRNNPRIPPNLQPRDVINEYPVEYSINGSNKVTTKVIGKGGCIIKDEFEIKGVDIYQTALPSTGNCDPAQIASNNYEINKGQVKIFYKSIINY